MKTLPMRVIARLLMFSSFVMFMAALVRVDLGMITHFQAGVRVASWGALMLVSAVVSDAVEL